MDITVIKVADQETKTKKLSLVVESIIHIWSSTRRGKGDEPKSESQEIC